MKMDVFWVLVGMTIMGGIFGLPGMIVGVPLFSVIYILVKERAEEKLTQRSMPTNTEYYTNLERPPSKKEPLDLVLKVKGLFFGGKKKKEEPQAPVCQREEPADLALSSTKPSVPAPEKQTDEKPKEQPSEPAAQGKEIKSDAKKKDGTGKKQAKKRKNKKA